jgi:peptide/nickel transport system permease protein
MIKYIAKRFLSSLTILTVLSAVVFSIFYSIRGTAAAISCGTHCSPQKIAANMHRLGLDQPLITEWLHFIKGLFVGSTIGDGTDAFHCPAPSLGYSFNNNDCVTHLISTRFPVTFSLALGAFIMWMILGVSLGILAARFRGGPIDRIANIFVLVGTSLPTFVLGLLIYIGAFLAHWIDPISQGMWISPFSDPWGFFKNFIFAWLTLALVSAAIYTRLTRGSVIETSGEDFIRTARAKGVPERKVLIKHNLRTALSPIISQAGLDFGALLGGAIITEQIFQLPGLGQLSIKAVTQTLDLPVIVGTTLLAATFILVFNFLVDIAYSILDPRVRVA